MMTTRSKLSIRQILARADAHRGRVGEWPTRASGPVIGAHPETWLGVDHALKRGGRGLPGGSSLAKLLAERRGRWHVHLQSPLTTSTILKSADAHHACTGEWPSLDSGKLLDLPHESWSRIDAALRYGRRGLRGGSSLPIFLAKHRGRRYQKRGGPLTESQIVQLAKSHYARTGQWPRKTSGPVKESPGDSWQNINHALHAGFRGLPGGISLLVLLAKRAGMRHRKLPPHLTIRQILSWADAHRTRTGRWPTGASGTIRGVEGETWLGIDHSLRRGTRGLSGGSSLAQLLAERRGKLHLFDRPRLTIKSIVIWAQEHHRRTGRWPIARSGPVASAPQETWAWIDAALHAGNRGLSGGTSLRRILTRHCGKYDRFNPPRLTVKQILQWADAHFARTGQWPHRLSGRIPGAPDETWNKVYRALKRSRRGLRGSTTLVKLLAKYRDRHHLRKPPRLTYKRILAWADAHYERTGDWPSRQTGPIAESPGESWSSVALAMHKGIKGMRPRYSLVQLLSDKRPRLFRRRGLPLNRSDILDWAAVHHEHHGAPPTKDSGPVRGASGETWAAIDASLRTGSRGLRDKCSLAEFLAEHYDPPYTGIGLPLTHDIIFLWADNFRCRVGYWPTPRSAYIDPSRTEKWNVIDAALREGLRGLPGGLSLTRLIREQRAQTRTPKRRGNGVR